MIPSGPIQGAMVGSPQDIQCIVSTVSGVELSSVMISWMGPGGGSITNDSRVTISQTTSSGNNYTSSLQFTYLMEGDEGMYTCNVMILETNASHFINLHSPSGTYTIYVAIHILMSNCLLVCTEHLSVLYSGHIKFALLLNYYCTEFINGAWPYASALNVGHFEWITMYRRNCRKSRQICLNLTSQNNKHPI